MINIVVPMAGLGSRFSQEGYTVPKPFIDVLGKPMVKIVLDNLALPGARFILIARREHMVEYGHVIESWRSQYDITLLMIDRVTEGQACTVLLAAQLINSNDPLLIANSDQLVDITAADFVGDSDNRGLDGSILTFPNTDPKWSFAAVDDKGIMTATKEKEAISTHATVGWYYFKKGSDFVASAAVMIASGDKTNNEYYACPVYNYGIAAGRRYGIYEITAAQMHGLGTPQDLNEYLTYAQQPAVV